MTTSELNALNTAVKSLVATGAAITPGGDLFDLPISAAVIIPNCPGAAGPHGFWYFISYATDQSGEHIFHFASAEVVYDGAAVNFYSADGKICATLMYPDDEQAQAELVRWQVEMQTPKGQYALEFLRDLEERVLDWPHPPYNPEED